MINPFKETNWKPGIPELRAFGRSLLIGFPIIASVFLLFFRWKSGSWAEWPLWLAGIGAAAGALFWLVPQIAKPAYFLWYLVACTIGLVVSNIIIMIVFYGVVTPIGLLLRLFGRDAMQRKFEPKATTYWLDAEKASDPQQYFRQF
jgi:hypothetical protein